jgi:hypothetical protein
LWLRNLSFWPQDIFIDVPLLQNRKGEPLDDSLVSVSQKPVRVEKYAAVTVALRIPPDKSHTISDATPVSGLVRIVSKSSNPDCKPAPQCQEPPGLSNLYIPIAISAPGSMRAGYLVAGACVAAGLVVLCIGSSFVRLPAPSNGLAYMEPGAELGVQHDHRRGPVEHLGHLDRVPGLLALDG